MNEIEKALEMLRDTNTEIVIAPHVFEKAVLVCYARRWSAPNNSGYVRFSLVERFDWVRERMAR